MEQRPESRLKAEDLKRSLPVLSVAGTIAYPGFVNAVPVSRPQDVAMVRGLENGDLVVQTIDLTDEEPPGNGAGTAAEKIGVAARVVTGLTTGDTVQVVLQGIERVQIVDASGDGPERRARVEPYICPEEPGQDLEDLGAIVIRRLKDLVRIDRQLSPELTRMAEKKRDDPSHLADFIASSLSFSASERQSLVEAPCVSIRLETLGSLLDRKLDALRLELEIQDRALARVEAGQKERLLREQLREIREALGESTDTSVVTSFRSRLLQASPPEEVRSAIETELHRLENLSPASIEYDVTRHHIEALLSLPWSSHAPTRIDLEAFERQLNADLVGLGKTKSEIMEFVTILKLNPDTAGPALAIVGPPGVGRSVIASTIARGLGRPFVRIDLESLESAEEVTGARTTSIGAEPGVLVKGLIEAGVMNPVILLDGLDAMREEATPRMVRALLSVLEPERRRAFVDDFLRVPIDLDGTLVIGTAGTPFSIPEPFVDSLAFVPVSSYIDPEKVEIIRRHLLPQQVDRNGLTGLKVEWSDEALLFVIRRYTREPGVWQLNRTLATLCRKLAREAALGHPIPEVMGEADVVRLLGRPRIPRPGTGRSDEIGVALGLAWTADGGDILPVEAIRLPGNGEVQLTGQLGEVMRESAAAAVSFVRSRFQELRVPPEAFLQSGIHINLPEGAIPKDGPSAGITLAVVIASIMTNRPVRHDVAMTGEITLRGKILPVGGIREKVLGAHRAGIRTIIIPAENAPDLEDVPESILNEMRFVPVEMADQAIGESLVPTPVSPPEYGPLQEPPPPPVPFPIQTTEDSRRRPAATGDLPRQRRTPARKPRRTPRSGGAGSGTRRNSGGRSRSGGSGSRPGSGSKRK